MPAEVTRELGLSSSGVSALQELKERYPCGCSVVGAKADARLSGTPKKLAGPGLRIKQIGFNHYEMLPFLFYVSLIDSMYIFQNRFRAEAPK